MPAILPCLKAAEKQSVKMCAPHCRTPSSAHTSLPHPVTCTHLTAAPRHVPTPHCRTPSSAHTSLPHPVTCTHLTAAPRHVHVAYDAHRLHPGLWDGAGSHVHPL